VFFRVCVIHCVTGYYKYQIFYCFFLYMYFSQPVDYVCIPMHNSVMRDKKSTQINVRMDKSMADGLRLLADELLTTPSQIVRKAVHDYLIKCKSSKQKG